MVLVAGEPCLDVERRCQRSWWDGGRRKLVCMEYATSRCIERAPAARFCMERNERGLPVPTLVHAEPLPFALQLACAKAGRRLCTEREWILACEGPEAHPFPSGLRRDAAGCGLDQPLTARSAAPTRGCTSAFAVEDLAGGRAELVAADGAPLPDPADGERWTLGGRPAIGERNECRSREPLRAFTDAPEQLGYRCCADPDGAVTDARTPSQRARGWSLERVERIGRAVAASTGPER